MSHYLLKTNPGNLRIKIKSLDEWNKKSRTTVRQIVIEVYLLLKKFLKSDDFLYFLQRS